MSRTSVPRISNDSSKDSNVKKDYGEFTFPNGDVYVGGYMIVKDKQFLSKWGRGIYVTQDFNKYEAHWVEDQIVNELIISHNNGTRYQGALGIDGEMFGFGAYTFIDNSVLESDWEHNNPVKNVILKDPQGSVWKGVYDGKEVAFTASNHFWDEVSPPTDGGEKKEDEENPDIDSNDVQSDIDHQSVQ